MKKSRSSSGKLPMELPPKKRVHKEAVIAQNPFNALSDDLIIIILCKISASAMTSSDLISIISTCKRFKNLGMDPLILASASGKSIWIRAKSWCDSAHHFLTRCANSGNTDACYFLGMIEFYCLGNHVRGVELLARAAEAYHPEALYSLAIIIFKGSGNSNSRDLYRATTLFFQSAALNHADALREVGYCTWNGIGFPFSPVHAVRLIISAEHLELGNKRTGTGTVSSPNLISRNCNDEKIISNYGFYKETGRRVHPANLFMVEWWWLTDKEDKREEGLRLCSHMFCGRRETRSSEFWRCSVCNQAAYCSFACQEIHWRMEHGSVCTHVRSF